MARLIMVLLLCANIGLVLGDDTFSSRKEDVLVNRLRMREALQENLKNQMQLEETFAPAAKSIPRAVLFSAAVPGAGQIYAGSYLKAALFMAAEVTALAVNIRYNSLGDKKRREFRKFADQNWDERRYWSYLYNRLREGNTPDGLPNFATIIDDQGRLLLDPAVYPQAREILRQYEDAGYIAGFSHRLPKTKTQQYYEMIGKYPEQFGNAWLDASFDAFYSGFTNMVTPMIAHYTSLRNTSNHFYDVAGYGTMVTLLNHVLSAIDAGFTTRAFNRRHMKLSYHNVLYKDEFVNMFGLTIPF